MIRVSVVLVSAPIASKALRGPDGQRVIRWFWVYRAVDPDELIARTIVTADLLDWLRTVAVVRLVGQGRHISFRAEPKPLDLRRRTSSGVRFRIDLAAVPMPRAQADELLSETRPDQPVAGPVLAHLSPV